MIDLAIGLDILLLVLALGQAVLVALFVRLFFIARPKEEAEGPWPKAAILLSLRGADPYLARGLRRLMTQNYPDYEIQIVVDRPEDAAWKVVEDAVRETGAKNVFLNALHARPEKCGLKCAALVQMAETMSPDVEVILQADADLVSHDNWMRDLVAPLREPGVGATFGNRWFMPRQGRWGSLVRYVWNAFAVVPMYVLKMPWGGTFAMRASVLRESELVEKWRRAIVEDAPVKAALEKLNLDLKFIPGLMMVNREECTLPFSLDFIKRQCTWTRIYHPNWWPLVVHALLTAVGLIGLSLLAIVGIALSDWTLVAWSAGGVGAYLFAMLGLILLQELAVRRGIRPRGEPTEWLSPRLAIKLFFVLPVTQIIHWTAVCLAQFRRTVMWRGITYRVKGPWDIEMVGYEPFQQPQRPEGSNVSL